MGKIYMLIDPFTKEVRYVGQTIKTLKYRLNEHVQDSKRYNYHSANWVKSLLKRGKIPIIELIEECPLENLDEREIYYISELSKTCNLTNIQKGGKDGSFIKHSEEAKKKISDFMKNYKKSQSSIDKMKLSLTRKVYQYGLDGVFIKEFSSIKELLHYGYLKDTVNKACRREGTAYNYNWRYYRQDIIIPKIPYFKSNEFKEKIKITNHKRSKKYNKCQV